MNAGLYYQDEESGFSANVAYNVFGPRIFSVGDVNLPDVVGTSTEFLGLPNMLKPGRNALKQNSIFRTHLNAAYRIYQDNNSDNEIARSGGTHSALYGWNAVLVGLCPVQTVRTKTRKRLRLRNVIKEPASDPEAGSFYLLTNHEDA